MQLCAPAIIYIGFSLTHILIDIYKQFFNSAFIKFIIMILFTIILNILCKRGLGIISWFIVFVPFIFMTVISSTLLFAFGLDPKSSGRKITSSTSNSQVIPMRPFLPGWDSNSGRRSRNRREDEDSDEDSEFDIPEHPRDHKHHHRHHGHHKHHRHHRHHGHHQHLLGPGGTYQKAMTS